MVSRRSLTIWRSTSVSTLCVCGDRGTDVIVSTDSGLCVCLHGLSKGRYHSKQKGTVHRPGYRYSGLELGHTQMPGGKAALRADYQRADNRNETHTEPSSTVGEAQYQLRHPQHGKKMLRTKWGTRTSVSYFILKQGPRTHAPPDVGKVKPSEWQSITKSRHQHLLDVDERARPCLVAARGRRVGPSYMLRCYRPGEGGAAHHDKGVRRLSRPRSSSGGPLGRYAYSQARRTQDEIARGTCCQSDVSCMFESRW